MSRRLTLAFLACVVHISAAENLSAQNLIISNARIIVGNGELIEQGSIVIRGGRIATVAEGAVEAYSTSRTYATPFLWRARSSMKRATSTSRAATPPSSRGRRVMAF